MVALIRMKAEGSGADLSAARESIDALRARLDSVKEIKKTLTAVDTATEKARDELDALRAAIAAEVDKIEEQVRASSAAAAKPE
jgi:predicted  nucleic acid-binding Zn-ribbon protein